MAAPIPSFHDGSSEGVQLAGGQAILTLKRVSGEIYELALCSVDALQMDKFREGNIIFSLEIIQATAPSYEILERLFIGPHPSAVDRYHDAHAKLLASKVAKVESGEAAVIVINPSYGASFAAYCASVTLKALAVSGS